MRDDSRLSKDHFPALRPRAETETTPDYLNYLSDTIELAHDKILQDQSPFYKILKIFNTKKPLGLDDIQNIFNEAQKLQNK